MKPLLYIESSVVSYLTGRPSNNTIIAGHQAATQSLWEILFDKFEPYISYLVLQEVSQGDNVQSRLRLDAIRDFPLLDVDEEVEMVARLLLEEKCIPSTSAEDAVHIAVAAVHGMDLIVTWNFKHINNPILKHRMRSTLVLAGYVLPEICSPDELTEASDD